MRKDSLQKKRTVKETTFQILKERILRQEIRAGDPLLEVAVANSLGVSRTPVREAIIQLQREGLVEVIPNRGAYVTFITLKELKNIIQLLQILEGAALDLAFDTLDRKSLKAMEAEFLALKKRGTEVSNEETLQQGVPLHDLILHTCGNEKLIEAANQLREKIRALTRMAVKKIPRRAPESVDEHLLIIHAIQKGDREAAKTAMTEHLANIHKVLTHVID